jgi:hypothetical protein
VARTEGQPQRAAQAEPSRPPSQEQRTRMSNHPRRQALGDEAASRRQEMAAAEALVGLAEWPWWETLTASATERNGLP